MIREAVWAGTRKFYPDDKLSLIKYLEKVIDLDAEKKQAKAVMLPHAGYFYSGAVAGKTVSRIKVPDTVIILGPNHTGLGMPYSIVCHGLWKTPIGDIEIAEDLADIILDGSSLITEDETAHIKEHSIEVELPFLKYLNPDVRIVPVIVSDFLLDRLQAVGNSISDSIKKYNKPVLIVVSSDMSHYEPQETVEKKDKMAIESILAMDPEQLYNRKNKEYISMCGFAPAIVALYACKRLGAGSAELVDYRTSAEANNDPSSVVGYAGIVIS